jgi:signal transduction histidine kinase
VGIIENLLILYSGILVINVVLSAVLWAHHRTALLGNLFWVWASAIVAFLAQVPATNALVITVGFAVTTSTTLAMAFLLARLGGLRVPWRLHLVLLATTLVLSTAAYRLDAPFWAVTLPTCLAVASPLAVTAARTLRQQSVKLTISGRALTLSCLAFSAHTVDFAFLRNRPEFTGFGFTVAILIAFALSITAPSVVLEHAVEERARVEELDRFKSRFFASITHELKTPLTMILAPLDLLLDGELGAITGLQRSTLQAMSRSGIKLLKLIGDLLDLSKLEESRLRLRVGDHDLIRYLRSLIAQTEPLAERKDITVKFSPACSEAVVCCDLERLERVFINLLSNAFKFTPAGGTVTVRVRDEDSTVVVGVEDTGPGFPPNLAERLFERFFQVENEAHGAHGGAGIGLALARELVELHGGSIWAEGERGKGAAFHVRLRKGRQHFDPLSLDRRERPSDILKGQRESDVGLTGWNLGFEERYRFIDIEHATEKRVAPRDADEEQRAHTVLVVEDSADVVRIIHLALHQHFRVFSAPDGAKGFAMAAERRPTLIITDLTMPEVDGIELTQQLRADARTRHIPIVMLSARSDLDDRVASLDVGVNAFVTKPFAPKELLSTVRSLLNAQESTAELVLTQQTATLESIAGGLAHEIRNPLNYIKNGVASVHRDTEELQALLAASRPLSDAEQAQLEKVTERMRRMFDTVQSGVKRISGTVELMIRYSREGYARVLQQYDLYAAIDDVLGIVVPATGSDAKVETQLVGDGVIDCVPDEINQVLTNLIQNALEATSPGHGIVSIAGRTDGEDLLLTIRDNGKGIEYELQSRIFAPFFTTKDVGLGLGMGLTITRRCIVALGGTISVRSQPGAGTEFSVRLPRRQKPRRDQASRESPARSVGEMAPASRPRER